MAIFSPNSSENGARSSTFKVKVTNGHVATSRETSLAQPIAADPLSIRRMERSCDHLHTAFYVSSSRIFPLFRIHSWLCLLHDRSNCSIFVVLTHSPAHGYRKRSRHPAQSCDSQSSTSHAVSTFLFQLNIDDEKTVINLIS